MRPQGAACCTSLANACTQRGHAYMQDGGPESLRPAYARAKVLAAEIAVVQRELDCSSIVYVLGRAHSRLGDKSNWCAALHACCGPFIAGWATSPMIGGCFTHLLSLALLLHLPVPDSSLPSCQPASKSSRGEGGLTCTPPCVMCMGHNATAADVCHRSLLCMHKGCDGY